MNYWMQMNILGVIAGGILLGLVLFCVLAAVIIADKDFMKWITKISVRYTKTLMEELELEEKEDEP